VSLLVTTIPNKASNLHALQGPDLAIKRLDDLTVEYGRDLFNLAYFLQPLHAMYPPAEASQRKTRNEVNSKEKVGEAPLAIGAAEPIPMQQRLDRYSRSPWR
jgi:hypothetical protein